MILLLAAAAVLAVAPDRVELVSASDDAYKALAIPRTYKTAPEAPNHLLVFRGGLCIRDIGLADTQARESKGTAKSIVVEEVGTTERGAVAADGLTAAIVRTRYDSRVDLTPGQTSAENDTVTGETTVTLIDPGNPEGKWKFTLESSRWVQDFLVLGNSKGVVITTFLPRNGPKDVRVIDPTGREWLRIPESFGAALRIEASPDAGHAAADVTFPDRPDAPERGVIVIDLASGKQWTYGWRYGSDAEPLSWKLLDRGVLAVKLPKGTKYFDGNGKKR
jgi:hypothetical protein